MQGAALKAVTTPINLVALAAAGAVSASLMQWAGAGVLSRTGHDQFIGRLSTAGYQGLLGGAVVNGGLGVLAALSPGRAAAVAFGPCTASALVAAVGAPPAGAAIMQKLHRYDDISALEAMRAGATGLGVVCGAAVALGVTVGIVGGTAYCATRAIHRRMHRSCEVSSPA